MKDDMIIAALDKRIETLSRAADLLRIGDARPMKRIHVVPGSRGHNLSAEGRDRIRQAQKARWAKARRDKAA